MVNAVMLACQYDPEIGFSAGEESSVHVQHFLSLLCSLQSTLLVWCGDLTVADSKELKPIAQTVIVQCKLKLLCYFHRFTYQSQTDIRNAYTSLVIFITVI